MPSLTTVGVSRGPYVGNVGGTLIQALPNYGTLIAAIVGNTNAAIEFLHLYDASASNLVSLGNTPPKAVIPVANGTVVPAQFGDGIQFLQGVVAIALTTLNGTVGAPVALPVTLVFETSPSD